MLQLRKKKWMKLIAVILSAITIWQPIASEYAYAGGGPTQPEFTSFEPVSTSNMVNEFTGAFTYNLPVLEIPGPNGSGYALSLSYHSGLSPADEASWVGWGWTLNPGAIVRNKRGFPDDYNGDTVRYYNKMPPSVTASMGANIAAEIYSIDLSASTQLRFNNYNGFGYTNSLGIGIAGMAGLNFSVSDGEGTFGFNINPYKILSRASQGAGGSTEGSLATNKFASTIGTAFDANLNNYIQNSFSHQMHATNIRPTVGVSFGLNFTAQIDPSPAHIGLQLGAGGSVASQTNKPEESLNAYGYMYTADAFDPSAPPSPGSPPLDVMDYYTERNEPYTKFDYYLPVPFSNADVFSVSGEEVGGGFRLHQRDAGHFVPTPKFSRTTIGQIGIDIAAGLNFGVGVNFSAGEQWTTVHGWRVPIDFWSTGAADVSDYLFENGGDEPYYFRFNNDGGGIKTHGLDDFEAQRAGLGIISPLPGLKEFFPSIPSSIDHHQNNNDRSGRSSFIAYHTNDEMLQKSNTNAFNRYANYEDAFLSKITRNAGGIEHQVGEFAIFSEQGNRHVYGLPVYSRYEKELQFGLIGNIGVTSTVTDFYQVEMKVPDAISPPSSSPSPADFHTILGQERDQAYATSYLLTEITTPDYVDLLNDGPTDDDLGGWTRFDYHHLYGTTNKSSSTGWYKWRTPYNGLLYEPGRLSDPQDDLGTMMSGEKEIYYLEKIETKTHLALFLTSTSADPRKDGLEAHEDESTAADDLEAQGTDRLKRLDRIELWSKDETGAQSELIKTIHFEYDYSLMEGIPNHDGTGTLGTGMLTLKKVWFEYGDIKNAKISPYEFHYNYPSQSHFDSKFHALYNDETTHGTSLTENPNYLAQNIDRWGSYQESGNARHLKMNPWVDQDPSSSFDPAAWHLKRIVLPSQGELLVQYEQNDYQYVHEHRAMAMVSIKDGAPNDDSPMSPKYYLNVFDDLGIVDANQNSPEIQHLKSLIENEIINHEDQERRKIYFKFLYNLLGPSNPLIGECEADYIDGYATVNNVDADANGLYIQLEPCPAGFGCYTTPREICIDYYQTQRNGVVFGGATCDGNTGVPSEAFNADDPDAAAAVGMTILNMIGFSFLAQTNPGVGWEDSYFRIPVPNPKLGGGVRVKRLLMYEDGIETGDASLYGNEYFYTTQDEYGLEISSGVASYEPQKGREENSMVGVLPRAPQGVFSRLIAGRDKIQLEGPLGETLYPSATVGYSRVITKNIHDGMTNSGFTVNEFNTTKDYPVSMDNTRMETEKDWLVLPLIVFNSSVTNVWATQGYVFELNGMHGQPKTSKTFSGDFSDPDSWAPSSSQTFEYFDPGEAVPVLPEDNGSPDFMNIGSETEVVFEMKAVEDISLNVAGELDIDVGLAGPIPVVQFSLFPSVSYSESRLNTHVTSKVVRHPVLQKSVTSSQNGIAHVVENWQFSGKNGKPIITKTTDGFDEIDLQQSANHDGTYLNVSMPAAEAFRELGQKAENEGRVIDIGCLSAIDRRFNSSTNEYVLFFTGSSTCDVCDFMDQFHRGDLLRIDNADDFWHAEEKIGNSIKIVPSGLYNNSSGNLTNITQIEIVKSGKNNKMEEPMMAMKIYGYGEGQSSNISYSPDPMRVQLANALNGFTTSNPFKIQLKPTFNSLNMKKIDIDGNCIYEPLTNLTTWNWVVVDISGFHGPDKGVIGITQYDAYSQSNPEFQCSQELQVNVAEGGGHFEVDPESGELVFYSADNSCCPQVIKCFESCGDLGPIETMDGIVSTSLTPYDDIWDYVPSEYITDLNPITIQNHNDFELGMKGKWRPLGEAVYESSISGLNATSPNARNYSTGTFDNMVMPRSNVQGELIMDNWKRLNKTEQFSPFGQVIEEQNLLDIYSCAKYGYNENVPYLVAQNSDYQSVQFESFEMVYTPPGLPDYWEDGLLNMLPGSYATGIAHSGQHSWQVNYNGSDQSHQFKSFKLTDQIANSGLLISFWAKQEQTSPTPDYFSLASWFNARVSDGVNSTTVTSVQLAKTGEWSLIECHITDFSAYTVGDQLDPYIEWNDPGVSAPIDVYFDDVRIQPYDAQVASYVYDKNTLKMLTSLDDQHFATRFQYNSEGLLIRKIKETERGDKTVEETYYNTPSVFR